MALVVESTYASDQRKMPSEQVAKDMLRDVLLDTENKNNLINNQPPIYNFIIIQNIVKVNTSGQCISLNFNFLFINI